MADKILLVSYLCPSRGHAGGLRILDIYAYLRLAHPNLRLHLYTHQRPEMDWSAQELDRVFDRVYLSPNESLSLHGLRQLGCVDNDYDVIDLQFHRAAEDVRAFRSISTKVIFAPMESQLRTLLISLRTPWRDLSKLALRRYWDGARNAWEEIRRGRMADEIVCVSKNDAATLRWACWPRKVVALETGLSRFEFGDELYDGLDHALTAVTSARVLFVAFFDSATNRDALKWYLDHVHPTIREQVPGYVLTVVGRGDLTAFASYADTSVDLVGEVSQLSPYIRQAAVGIAPALSGSGFRGKVNQYALFGVPCVVSPLSLKGLAYVDKREVLLARSAEQFARCCAALLLDPILRQRIGRAARKRCLREYTWEAKDAQIAEIYGVARSVPQSGPRVTVLVPSFNHAAYLQQRIASILSQSYRNIELIVIDDGSTDHSDKVIQRLQQTADFTYIRNTRNSGSPFSAWERGARMASGDFIWICESDDFAESDFLETAVAALLADRSAALYYCNSRVVDDLGVTLSDTSDYFAQTWRDSRWKLPFATSGEAELFQFQLRGQTVPNMSSALIEITAFRLALSPVIKRFRLTGDWLFIGRVMQHGRVVFDPSIRSNFRKHSMTARAQVPSARSQAEFVLTKFLLFKQARRPAHELAPLLAIDVFRFRQETARWFEVVFAMLKVSWLETFKCGMILAYSVATTPRYMRKLAARYLRGKV